MLIFNVLVFNVYSRGLLSHIPTDKIVYSTLLEQVFSVTVAVLYIVVVFVQAPDNPSAHLQYFVKRFEFNVKFRIFLHDCWEFSNV